MPSVAKASVPTVIGRTPPKPVVNVGYSATYSRKDRASNESRHHSSSHALPADVIDAHHRNRVRETKSANRQNLVSAVDYRPPITTKHRQHTSSTHDKGNRLLRNHQHRQLHDEHVKDAGRRRRHSSSSTVASRPKLYPSLSVLKRVDEYIRAGRDEDRKKTPSKQPRPLTPVDISDEAAYSADHHVNAASAHKSQQPDVANGTKLIRKSAAVLHSERISSLKEPFAGARPEISNVARDKDSKTYTPGKLPAPAGCRPVISKLHNTSFTTGATGVDPRVKVTSSHGAGGVDKRRQASFSEELDEDNIRQLIRQAHRFKRAFYSIKRDEDSFRDQLNRLLDNNRALRRYYMALKSELQLNHDRQDDMAYRIDTVRGLLDEYCLPLLDTVHTMSREEKNRMQRKFNVCQRRTRSQSRPTRLDDCDDFVGSMVNNGARKSRAVSPENFNEPAYGQYGVTAHNGQGRHTPDPAGWKRLVVVEEQRIERARHTQRTASSDKAAAGDNAAATDTPDNNFYARKDDRGAQTGTNGYTSPNNTAAGDNFAASDASSPIYINIESLQQQALQDSDAQPSNTDAARLRRRAERVRKLLLSEQPHSSDSEYYLLKPATARESDDKRRSIVVSERLKKRVSERLPGEAADRSLGFLPGEAACSSDESNINVTEKRNEFGTVAEVSGDPGNSRHYSDGKTQASMYNYAGKRLQRKNYRELAHRILRGANSLDDLSTLTTESEKEAHHTASLPISRSDQQVGGNTAVKATRTHFDAPLPEIYASRYGGSGDASAQYNAEIDRMRADGSGDNTAYYAVENDHQSNVNTGDKRSVSRNNKFHLLAYREGQIERIRQICDENVEQRPSSNDSAPPPVPPRRGKPSQILPGHVLQQQQQQLREQHYMTTPQNTPPTSSIGLKKDVVRGGEAEKLARKITQHQHASVMLMTPKHNNDDTTTNNGPHHLHHRRPNSPFDLAPVPPPRLQRHAPHPLLFKRYQPAITTADGRLVYNVGIQTEPPVGVDDVDFQQRQRQSDTFVVPKQQTTAVGTASDNSNNAAGSNNSPAKVSNTISTGSETQNQSTQTDSSLMTPSPPSKQTTASSTEDEQIHRNNNVRFNDDRNNNNFMYYNENPPHQHHHRHHTHMPAPPTAPLASSGSSATPTTPHNHHVGGGFPPNSNADQHQQQTIYCLHDEIAPQSAAYNLLARSQQQKTRNVLHYPLAGQVPIFPASVQNAGRVLVVKRALKMKHFKHADKYILRCPDELQIVQNNASGGAVPPPLTLQSPETPQPSTSLATAAAAQSGNAAAAAAVGTGDIMLNETRIKRMGGVLALPAAVASAAAALAGRTVSGGVAASNISSVVIESGSTVVETIPKHAMCGTTATVTAAAALERDQQHSSTRSTTSVKVLQQERRSLETDAVIGSNTMRSSLSSSNRPPPAAAGQQHAVVPATPDSVVATIGGSRSVSAAPPQNAARVLTRNSKTTNLQDVSLSTVQFVGDVCPTKAGGYSIMFRSRTDNQVRLV